MAGLSGPVRGRVGARRAGLRDREGGPLKVVNPGASTATTILDISGRVLNNHDRGLLGIAVDTAFATNRYVYLLYSYDTTPLTPDGDGRTSRA